MSDNIKRIWIGATGAIVAVLIIAVAEWSFNSISALFGRPPPFPSGAVVAFDLKKCPSSGWQEYKLAHGKFIRGIDRSGTKIDPDGERKPGAPQKDSFKSHFHTQDADIHGKGGGYWMPPPSRHFHHSKSQSKTSSVGGAETRPINVALLYCRKT